MDGECGIRVMLLRFLRKQHARAEQAERNYKSLKALLLDDGLEFFWARGDGLGDGEGEEQGDGEGDGEVDGEGDCV